MASRIYLLLSLSKHTFEANFICKVEDNEDSICFLKVTFGKGKEFLLTCCIPNTNSDLFLIEVDYFLFESEA